LVRNADKIKELEALLESKIATVTGVIPNNLIDFMDEYQPLIGRKVRSFDLSPFWVEPLLDNHPNIMFVNGRQTFKTTNSGSMIAWAALQKSGSEVTYVADDEEHKGAFSEQRLRNEVFLSNNRLRPFLPGGKASVGRIRINNGSVIYLVTDEQVPQGRGKVKSYSNFR